MEAEENRKLFALLGKNISYSFSRGYFTEKFDLLELRDHQYINFDIDRIQDFPAIFQQYEKEIKGLNVTIPYKETVIDYLDKIDKKAKKIGAVNTIRITKKGKLKGYNTDEYGFRKSLQPLVKKHHKKALILGTGGASKAVQYALQKLGIDYTFVSRNPTKNQLSYQELSRQVMNDYLLLINCTPLGTYPNVEDCPAIPYHFLTSSHILYDLVYNPEETAFLLKGKERGATTKNGMEMLELQAEKAWKIWNK